VRSDPHVLVVGDPGLGKSQLLKACTNIAPRGVYVCGNSTTTAGLTVLDDSLFNNYICIALIWLNLTIKVTLTKDGGGEDFALEAG
jgi:DNA replicative helicase MCM subunit Mcm2 (Cdc46/Mcm family)